MTAGNEPARTGWRRDDMADMWVNGRHRITDEVVVGFARERVQAYAVVVAGVPLPDEAFRILPAQQMSEPVRTALIKGLSATRADDR